MWTAIKLAFGVATGGVGAFLSGFLSWALKHWKAVVILAGMVAAGITYKIILTERNNARAQVTADAKTIDTLTQQKQALQANVNALAQQITLQNASVVGLKAAADAAQQKASKAVQDAIQSSQKDASKIAALQKRGADQTNKGTCDDEITRIRSGL